MKQMNVLFEKVLAGESNEHLQIYSNHRQCNVLDDNGNSLLNIIFDTEDNVIKFYPAYKPGYVDYNEPSLVCGIDGIIEKIPYIKARDYLLQML